MRKEVEISNWNHYNFISSVLQNMSSVTRSMSILGKTRHYNNLIITAAQSWFQSLCVEKTLTSHLDFLVIHSDLRNNASYQTNV